MSEKEIGKEKATAQVSTLLDNYTEISKYHLKHSIFILSRCLN